MEPNINEHFFEEKLTELEQAKSWSPRVISKLETFIRTGDDYSLFRINPFSFGKEKNIPEHEASDLFLYGAKYGLFYMNWQLVCPVCSSVVESFKSLTGVHSSFFCSLCHIDIEATLDDYIQITFTVAPQIREISFHHPESLSVEDYCFKYNYSKEAFIGEGRTFGDMVKSMGHSLTYIPANETMTFEMQAKQYLIVGHDYISGASFFCRAAPEAKPEVQSIKIQFVNGKFQPERPPLFMGAVRFEIENSSSKKIALLLMERNLEGAPPAISFPPFLSGKKLLTTQTFRDLFRSEVIQGTEGLSVKDITILFTDLKGSTAMYDRIGDLKAFSLVRQHFEHLGKVINQYEGATIKTIGDAVMATFLNPFDAVQAALEMLSEIERFNIGLPKKEVILKIGVHRGSSIAVTLNDRLDYFGQSVNIAARIQNLADANEICISEEVYNYQDVRDILKNYDVQQEKAKLRGIEDEMNVYKIRSLTP